MKQFSHEIKVAQGLAREAGKIIMEVYSTEFSVTMKGVGDPVTEADKKANAFIVERLLKEFPRDGVIAEESPGENHDAPSGRTWYVDPLDGTKEFIKKNGEFSVMIGLSIQGCSCLGVVYRPDQDLLYSGIVNQGAWVEDRGQKNTLSVVKPMGKNGLRLAVSRSHRHKHMDEIERRVGIKEIIPSGSVGLKVGLITRGLADIYIEPGPFTSLWDSCAPEALIRGAGGKFTDLLGAPLFYGTEEMKNKKGLVASMGEVHDHIIQAISPLISHLE